MGSIKVKHNGAWEELNNLAELPIPVTNGGTGATTAAAARTNLAVPEKPVLLWSGTFSESGSLTVAASGGSSGCTGLGNISDYEWCIFDYWGSTQVFVHTGGSELHFGYIYKSNSGSNNIGFLNMTLSNNTLTFDAIASYGVSNNSGVASGSEGVIYGIYGFVKKTDVITS